MRPIPKGYYRATDLLNGTVDLEMVARCNDVMDLEAENERRMIEYFRNKARH